MTARKVLLSLTIMVTLFCGIIEGSIQRVIATKNEFGGKTVVEVYLPEDPESTEVLKVISYYDGSNRCVKKDGFLTVKSASETGVDRTIFYLSSNEKRTKEEYFYTDQFAKEKGFTKRIDYFDINEKETKHELFLTDKAAGDNGFVERIDYLDGNGKIRASRFCD